MGRGGFLLISLALALGCAGGPGSGPEPEAVLLPEAGAPPLARGSWQLTDGSQLRLAHGVLTLTQDDLPWQLADEVAGVPSVSAAGDRLAYARRSDGVALSAIEVWNTRDDGSTHSWTGPRVLADSGDRPALSPDGELLAFVSGRTGIASVWLIPFHGGELIQLTNRGLSSPALSPVALDGPRHPPGQPPPGFIPPPHDDPPRFDGDRLVWDAPDGAHEVALP